MVFLSEAFTRPKVMKALAKLGFTQSYTYFTWRTTKAELSTYLHELTQYPMYEYFRPNFFVSTPDINPLHLQSGEPWMYKSRVALAATLSSNYGIYNGFELIEHEPIPGKEEFLNSEKYEIKVRDWNKPGNIKDYIGRLNRLRKDNAALLQTSDFRLTQVDDDQVIGFVKESVRRRQCGRGRDRADRPRTARVLVPFRRSRDRPGGRAPPGRERREPGDRRASPYRVGRCPAAHRSRRRSRPIVPLLFLRPGFDREHCAANQRRA